MLQFYVFVCVTHFYFPYSSWERYPCYLEQFYFSPPPPSLISPFPITILLLCIRYSHHQFQGANFPLSFFSPSPHTIFLHSHFFTGEIEGKKWKNVLVWHCFCCLCVILFPSSSSSLFPSFDKKVSYGFWPRSVSAKTGVSRK